jgi:hypothetical protein
MSVKAVFVERKRHGLSCSLNAFRKKATRLTKFIELLLLAAPLRRGFF